MMIPAPDNLKPLFPTGFTPGMGFGLSCAQVQPGGSMILHTLTGRGPVLPGPSVAIASASAPALAPAPAPASASAHPEAQASTPAPAPAPASGDNHALAPSSVFVLPGFNPSIVTIKLQGDRAEVIGLLPLKDEDGKPVRGLPPATVEKNSTQEIPLGLTAAPSAKGGSPQTTLARFGFDEHGLDPQGVAYDFKRGVYWLADGYRPALVGISPGDGSVRRMFAPGEGLEPRLAARRPGWGFAGVHLSPGGKIYTIMRGVLIVAGKPAVFSRIIELDPDTERVRQLPYPIDLETFPDPAQVSTTEVGAVADKHVLILEQGMDKQGRPRSLVYSVDLSPASNINYVHDDDGLPPEAVTDMALLRKDVQMPRKTLMLDLREAGFTEAQAESMTLLSGERTLAIMGGHGFGLQEMIAGFATGPDGKPVLAPGRYQLAADGTLGFDGQPSKAAICVGPTRETPRLWLVSLPKKASDY
jgi:hypothetical protein